MSLDLLFDEELPADHRSGFVTIAGRPNVGKSTLLNYFLGQKLAIVSPKPQTTRNQLLGILTLPTSTFTDLAGQVIFVDTPGIHTPHHKLGEYLLETAQKALPEADVIIWLADVTRSPGPEELLVVESILAARDKAAELPVILALNKVDVLPPGQEVLDETAAVFLGLFPEVTEQLFISATRGDNCDELLRRIVNHLPPGPRFFPEEQVTDQHVRFLAAELIREAALTTLREEVPHALAVVVTEFKARHENLTYISANLVLERKSQKQIVIGQKGRTLKKIGRLARSEIEELVGSKVYLDLWVKVRPGWRKKKKELKWLGYSVPD